MASPSIRSLVFSVFVSVFSVQAQIRINEIFADNKSYAYTDGSTTDWVEIINTTSQTVVLNGFSLTDTVAAPRKWVFPDGTSIVPNGYLVVLLDSARPASTNAVPILNAGFGADASGDRIEIYGPGAIPVLIESVRFGPQAANYTIGRVPNGTGDLTLTTPTPNAPNVQQAVGSQITLKINEWMAAPSSGDDWFELYNPDPLPVLITGLHFRDNGNTPSPVAPLSYIGSGTWSFLRIYADNGTNDNEVAFGLSGNGDSIGLYRQDNSQVDRVQFGVKTENMSQGRMPDGSENIRTLTVATPGDSNLTLYPGLVVNEVLSHTDPPYEDAVEFYNITGTPIPIGGWYLSNSRTDLKRYRIPDNTEVPANGYVVFYENQFNGPNALTPFTFNAARGDQVFLAQAINGDLTGSIVQESFEPADNAVSFGRLATSISGDYKFVALQSPTFGFNNPATVEQFRTGTGAANAPPRVGPVVISEFHYNPVSPDGGVTDNTNDEFIELTNISGGSVLLYDPLFPENRWRLQGGVELVLPTNTTLEPGETAVLVSFDPNTNATLLAQFRTRFSIPQSVRIFGPYGGKLNNSGDEIELYKPDAPQPPGRPDAGLVPYIRVDKVNYSDLPPWPYEADGLGKSLHRAAASVFGNDPANWVAVDPTPGRAGEANDGIRVAISRTGSAFQLQFNAIAGQSYTIQFKDDLLPSTSWQTLTTVTSSGFTVEVLDTTVGHRQRLYRVVAG